jgi:quinol monooxygenase YgiN
MNLLSASCLFLFRSSNAFSISKATSLAIKTPLVSTRPFTSTATVKMSEKPFSVIVEAEIKEDRMEEFMSMIENNAQKSRKEPGCIRFGTIFLDCSILIVIVVIVSCCLTSPVPQDVLQDQSQQNKFWFYEIYENAAAVDFHKTQAHYQAWADFKESGGTISSVSNKADGIFIGAKASS